MKVVKYVWEVSPEGALLALEESGEYGHVYNTAEEAKRTENSPDLQKHPEIKLFAITINIAECEVMD